MIEPRLPVEFYDRVRRDGGLGGNRGRIDDRESSREGEANVFRGTFRDTSRTRQAEIIGRKRRTDVTVYIIGDHA